MNIDKVISELWEYLFNKYSHKGVAIISHENFGNEMELLQKRNQDAISRDDLKSEDGVA